MCGRFAQYSSRDDYFDALGIGPEELTRDAEPIGRYNVAPGTKVLLLSGKRIVKTVFHFCPCFLPWTLSRTWTLPWTETRPTPTGPGSSQL